MIDSRVPGSKRIMCRAVRGHGIPSLMIAYFGRTGGEKITHSITGDDRG